MVLALPTATVTGMAPVGGPRGTVKLICATPTRSGVMPSNWMVVGVGRPFTVTVTVCVGAGRALTGVPAAGARGCRVR